MRTANFLKTRLPHVKQAIDSTPKEVLQKQTLPDFSITPVLARIAETNICDVTK